MRFASFLSGGFLLPLERKLEKLTSVQWVEVEVMHV